MSQTLDKWANLVNWDGYSHWSTYITFSPRFMGPNSLPVPLMGNGSIDTNNFVGIEGGFHFSKGDNAQNIKLNANYCLHKDLISVQLSWLPKEMFQTEDAVKIKRKVYYHNYNDTDAEGDIVLNTTIQLMNRWRKYQHLALRIGYRFPTSGGVGAARFTDAPGYYFDLSAARIMRNNPKWKMIAMAGFYVWQMNGYGQNDALLFGAGSEYNSASCRIQVFGSGYLGWRNNGDDPIIIGTLFEKKVKHVTLSVNLRHGLHDSEYTSAELGLKYNFLPAKPKRFQFSGYVL